MSETGDEFVETFRRLLELGGFTVYSIYAPGAEHDDDAPIEALFVGRSQDAINAAALHTLTDKSKAPN